MRAQVTLIPTESKKLIAKAIARTDEVQNAFHNGIVAIHPSSSTIFIVEELVGKLPDTDVWVCGIIGPKAACVSRERSQQSHVKTDGTRRAKSEFPNTWLIQKGKLSTGTTLAEILDRMKPDDIYIKGVNAVDTSNVVGILGGDATEEGGTLGLVMARARHGAFKVVFPAGLEKLIPISIKEAAKEASFRNVLDYSMGMPCTLTPCEGIVVTELRAIEILSGAKAVPISAGGLGGAEGAVTMVIKGSDEEVTKAINYIEGVKGTKLPREVLMRECKSCESPKCSLKGGVKPWC